MIHYGFKLLIVLLLYNDITITVKAVLLSPSNFIKPFFLSFKGCSLTQMVLKQSVSTRLMSKRKQPRRIKTTRGC